MKQKMRKIIARVLSFVLVMSFCLGTDLGVMTVCATDYSDKAWYITTDENGVLQKVQFKFATDDTAPGTWYFYLWDKDDTSGVNGRPTILAQASVATSDGNHEMTLEYQGEKGKEYLVGMVLKNSTYSTQNTGGAQYSKWPYLTAVCDMMDCDQNELAGAVYVNGEPVSGSVSDALKTETQTYDITLDRTNYAEGYVDLYTYDSEGSNVANTQENNATITMPEGGKVRVFADSAFTVTAEGTTISEMLSADEEGYYYEITGITADTTIVVESTTPPAGGTECDHDWEVLYDADDHYRKCVDCQQEADRAAHTFTNNVCSICGYEKKYTITIEYENFEGTENIDLRYMLYNTEADYVKTVSLDGQTSFEIPVGCTFNTFIYNDIDYDYTVTLKSGEADIVYDGWDRGNGNPIYVTVSLDSDITIVLTKIAEGGGNVTPPVADSCTVTIDSTNLAEGALLAALRVDSEGHEMGESIELTNGSTVEIPKDGGLLVMSNSSNFKVTVSDTTLAKVGDLMVGKAESGYYISEIKDNITVVVESTTQGGGNEKPPAGGDGVTGDISSVTITNHIFDDIFADIQDGTLNSYSNEDLYLHAWPKVTVLNKNGEVLKTYINNPYIAHRTNSGWEVCDCGNTLNDSEHGILLLFQTDYNHGNDQEDLTSIVSIDSDTLVIDKAWADYSIYPRTGAIYVAIVPGTSGGNENPPATDTYDITLDRTNYAEGYVDLYTYDGEGRSVENTQENNDTITMPEGGKVRVFADSEFTVTAEGATVSEMLSAGDEGYYYEITGIAADTTIVVNLKQNTPVVVAPAITSQPQNISVQEGQKATFSVTATGDNLSYQWQIDRNDGNGFVNLSGATSASYTTSTVDMDCNGFKYQCIVSNEGGSLTTNIATLTVTESSSVHTHSLTLVPAKAATCTTAGNKAYYICSGCDSLFADANGTTITTAEAVKVAALDHDWTGEWTIIKEATETEDGKKETLCTRGCGHKKVAIIPATGTTDDNGNLEKDVEIAPDAPIDEATLNNSKEKLLEADNIFTDAEKTQIANGTDASVWIEISKTDESAIASTDKAKIEQEATKIMGNNPTITYFDVDLFKQVGSGAKQEITEPGIAMKITIVIPDELLNNDKKVSREYKIIRLHEGQVDVINGTFDSTTGEFTFETDKFSTYAIVYKDMPVNDDDTPTQGDTDVIKPEDDKQDEVAKTGDSNAMLCSFMFMLLSGLGIIISSRKKKILNKES